MEKFNWFLIIQETLMITSFVIVVMLAIEFINVVSGGFLNKKLKSRPLTQLITAVVLGALPGCMGTFTAVSLYTHRLLSFGSIVAVMIATSGDEAYFMLALMPEKAILIFLILSVIAFFTGWLIDKFIKTPNFTEIKEFSFDVHENDCINTQKNFSLKNFNFNPKRIIISIIFISFAAFSALGIIGHSHTETLVFSLPDKYGDKVKIENVLSSENHIHSKDCEHHYHENEHSYKNNIHNHNHEIDWVKITILISSILALIIVLFTNEHFIETHVWKHLIVKHLPKIIFWIFLTLILISFILNYAEIGTWIYKNPIFVLLIALALGIIPQSGPHLVFLIMYLQGLVPFSILLASSSVQDGHGSLPLLAESKKSFVYVKFFNILVGILIGAAGLIFKF